MSRLWWPSPYDAPLEEGDVKGEREAEARAWRGLHGEATSGALAYGGLELGAHLVQEVRDAAEDFSPPTSNPTRKVSDLHL